MVRATLTLDRRNENGTMVILSRTSMPDAEEFLRFSGLSGGIQNDGEAIQINPNFSDEVILEKINDWNPTIVH